MLTRLTPTLVDVRASTSTVATLVANMARAVVLTRTCVITPGIQRITIILTAITKVHGSLAVSTIVSRHTVAQILCNLVNTTTIVQARIRSTLVNIDRTPCPLKTNKTAAHKAIQEIGTQGPMRARGRETLVDLALTTFAIKTSHTLATM